MTKMDESLSLEDKIKLIDSKIEDMKKRNVELKDVYDRMKSEASQNREDDEEITDMVKRIREQHRTNAEQWMRENGYEDMIEKQLGEK